MSKRIAIPSLDPAHIVVVGWDNPYGTFFAQIDYVEEQDRLRQPVILWLGSTPATVLTPEEMVGPLAPYAELTEDHLAQLNEARADDKGRRPTALQRTMLGRMMRT